MIPLMCKNKTLYLKAGESLKLFYVLIEIFFREFDLKHVKPAKSRLSSSSQFSFSPYHISLHRFIMYVYNPFVSFVEYSFSNLN